MIWRFSRWMSAMSSSFSTPPLTSAFENTRWAWLDVRPSAERMSRCAWSRSRSTFNCGASRSFFIVANEAVVVRQRHFENDSGVFQLVGNLGARTRNQNRLFGVLEALGEISQLAYDAWLVAPALVEIAQDDNDVLFHLLDCVEGAQWIFGGGKRLRAVREAPKIVGMVPDEQGAFRLLAERLELR